MATYKVTFERIYRYTYEIEANSEQAALERGIEFGVSGRTWITDQDAGDAHVTKANGSYVDLRVSVEEQS